MEYVAIVALVLFVLAVGTVVVAAPGVANGVVEGLRRGLCVVSGTGCVTLEQRPCVVVSDTRDQSVTVHVAFVRISDHAGLLRQTMSDGTVVVTLVDDAGLGAELGLGASGHVDVGGVHLGTGELTALSGMGVLGARRAWHVPDAAAADRLVKQLRGPTGVALVDRPIQAVAGFLGIGGDDDRDRPPAPDVVTFTAGAQGIAEAHLDGALADVDLQGVGQLSGGVSWDHRTGERTLLIRGDGKVAVQLAHGIFKGRLRGVDAASAALVFDRSGAPKELVVSAVGQLDRGLLGSFDRHGLALQRRSGERAEVDARLDLTEPDNLRAVRIALAQVTGDPPLSLSGVAEAVGSLGPLAHRIDDDGRIDVRTYEASSTSGGVGLSGAFGGRFGADVGVGREGLSLSQAWSRPPGGVWQDRVDCTKARR
jgi:hypothetical protein